MRRRPISLTIRQKLLVAMVPAMMGVVGFLVVLFSAQQLETMSDDLHRRAAIYGELARGQVMSTVAFSDRETAREVLSSIQSDPDISAIVLFGADRQRLYARGDASPWVDQVTAETARVVDTQHHVSAIVPIQSLEGPRGTLVIQLSTSRLEAQRRHVVITALLVGLGALGFSGLIAWLIARRFARRLDKIAQVARSVSAGDMSHAVDDPIVDEIGAAARALDGMVARLRDLMAAQQIAAQREHERLEGLVADRTAELDARNAEMRYVFDHVDQGFLTVGFDGTIAHERSAAVERWLGPIKNRSFVDYVREFAPIEADWFEMSWGHLAAGTLPVELCLAQLPSQFEVGGRHVEMSFKALTDCVLVVVSDSSAEVERRRANRDEAETTALFAHMLRDPAGYAAFHGEATALVAIVANVELATDEFARALHTLKGIAALEKILSISELCHEIENDRMENDEVDALAKCCEVVERWKFLMDKIAPIADQAVERVDVSLADLAQLEAAIADDVPRHELAVLVDTLRMERVGPRLHHLADQARLLAMRLCKDPIDVRVEVDPDLRLPTERWRPVWSSLVHLLRNAIDHGLENPSERALLGKPAVATLELRAVQDDTRVALEIRDGGRGIDWQRVAEVARARGLPSATAADLTEALFFDGVSTRTDVSETSGRGVGLAAFRATCEASGGRVAVASRPGHGTTFTITWPRPTPVVPVRANRFSSQRIGRFAEGEVAFDDPRA